MGCVLIWLIWHEMGPTKEILILHRSKLTLLPVIHSEFSVSFLFPKPPSSSRTVPHPSSPLCTSYCLSSFLFNWAPYSSVTNLNLIAYNLLNIIEFCMWFLFANDNLLASKTTSVCSSPSKSQVLMVARLNKDQRYLRIILADLRCRGNMVTWPSLITHHQGTSFLCPHYLRASFSKGTLSKVTC